MIPREMATLRKSSFYATRTEAISHCTQTDVYDRKIASNELLIELTHSRKGRPKLREEKLWIPISQ
jgi:hypothetical protein